MPGGPGTVKNISSRSADNDIIVYWTHPDDTYAEATGLPSDGAICWLSAPSRRFLNVDYRCSSWLLKRITDTVIPHKTGIRLSGVARNPANGFPARLLVLQRQLV